METKIQTEKMPAFIRQAVEGIYTTNNRAAGISLVWPREEVPLGGRDFFFLGVVPLGVDFTIKNY